MPLINITIPAAAQVRVNDAFDKAYGLSVKDAVLRFINEVVEGQERASVEDAARALHKVEFVRPGLK